MHGPDHPSPQIRRSPGSRTACGPAVAISHLPRYIHTGIAECQTWFLQRDLATGVVRPRFVRQTRCATHTEGRLDEQLPSRPRRTRARVRGYADLTANRLRWVRRLGRVLRLVLVSSSECTIRCRKQWRCRFRSHACLCNACPEAVTSASAHLQARSLAIEQRPTSHDDETSTAGFTKKIAEQFFMMLGASGAARVVDLRLNNVWQLAGVAKKADLQFFLSRICAMDYVHLPGLAPTQQILDRYRKEGPAGRFSASVSRSSGCAPGRDNDAAGSNRNGVLLCSEDKPLHCHRRLVAEYLRTRCGEIAIVHLT
ncbi:MAG: DUF488 domain-containing protein [Betaproteobacteria bacterium]